jgi:predicted acylesterase/phospholipase RssA
VSFFIAGLYHFGHVLGLLEAGILPHIISGTSGGSVVGAVLCTRTDEELRRDLNPEVLVSRLTCFARPWSERLKSVWKDGNLFDFDDWMERIKW